MVAGVGRNALMRHSRRVGLGVIWLVWDRVCKILRIPKIWRIWGFSRI